LFLTTAGIYCTISPPLSGAMDGRLIHFIVRAQQLQNVLSPKVLYVCVTTNVGPKNSACNTFNAQQQLL